ncbi:MAG: SDR family NAD(P)-dependent oxidoreductase [Candidatus Pacebacteria bacterium]|nr:SDR family NAD(P)-dependent oxidoreductase [Candidatus Paceibacterota bacterium]
MKTALITGIDRGIGRALAEKFLAEGYAVIGTSLSGEINLTHQNLSVYQLDLSSPKNIASCVQSISQNTKGIDILINNAGILLDKEETKVIVDKLRKTLEVNLIGTIDFTERLVSSINAGGHIVNISSTAGSLEYAGEAKSHYPYHYPDYKISKAALNMYARTLALRMKEKNIIVSSVHPGWVRTEIGGECADVSPEEAAEEIFKTAISRPETGQFWFKGEKLPW